MNASSHARLFAFPFTVAAVSCSEYLLFIRDVASGAFRHAFSNAVRVHIRCIFTSAVRVFSKVIESSPVPCCALGLLVLSDCTLYSIQMIVRVAPETCGHVCSAGNGFCAFARDGTRSRTQTTAILHKRATSSCNYKSGGGPSD